MAQINKAKIVICEFMAKDSVHLLQQHFNICYEPNLNEDSATLKQRLVNADALIVRNKTQVNAHLLQAAEKLKVIGRLGVGLDNIDLHYCRENNIKVIPATGANARAVAEYVIAATLLLMRGCFMQSALVASGQWPRLQMSSGHEVFGKTMGLVGFGGIGRLVAHLAAGLGMQVIAFDSKIAADDPVWKKLNVQFVHFEELVQSSDAISLHVPLTRETKNLFNAQVIRLMRPTAVLINTARGGIVDEQALMDALNAQKIAGAALDVFSQEPLPDTVDFKKASNLILTPHIAGVSTESNIRVSDFIAKAVRDFLICL